MAAPAYAGIPLTARGLAASVAIMTGHCAGSGASPLAIPTADTLVVLMGVANAAALRDQLIAAGRSGDTPAAVIEWGTCARQRVAVATIATLPDVIATRRPRSPGRDRHRRDRQASIGARLARSVDSEPRGIRGV